MHYKNGREAKIGDQVVGRDVNGHAVAGILVEGNAQSETCNGRLMPALTIHTLPLVSIKDCLHIDDAIEPAKP